MSSESSLKKGEMPSDELSFKEIYRDLKSGTSGVVENVSEFGKLYSVFSLIMTVVVVLIMFYFSWKLIKYNSEYVIVKGTVTKDSVCSSVATTDSKGNKTGTRDSCQTTIKYKPNTACSTGSTGSSSQKIIYQQILRPENTFNSTRFNNLSNQDGFIVGYDDANCEYHHLFSDTTRYKAGDKIDVYYRPGDNIDTSATLSIIPNFIAYLMSSIALFILISSIFWTYVTFKNKAVSTLTGGVGLLNLFRGK